MIPQLKNNIIQSRPGPASQAVLKTQGLSPLDAASSTGGMVYIANCTVNPVNAITVGGTSLTTLPAGSAVGQGTQMVGVNRFGSAPVFGSSTSFSIVFLGGQSYQQTIVINEPPMVNLTLWCFYDSLILTDENGYHLQIAWGL